MPSKYVLYLCFSSSVMLFCFFCRNTFWFLLGWHHKYLNVLFVFRYHSLFATIQLYSVFMVMLHCFNTTFFSCLFSNFYNHFIHTHTKNIKIVFDFTLLNLIISYFSFLFLKLSFIFSYLSFSFKTVTNYS